MVRPFFFFLSVVTLKAPFSVFLRERALRENKQQQLLLSEGTLRLYLLASGRHVCAAARVAAGAAPTASQRLLCMQQHACRRYLEGEILFECSVNSLRKKILAVFDLDWTPNSDAAAR